MTNRHHNYRIHVTFDGDDAVYHVLTERNVRIGSFHLPKMTAAADDDSRAARRAAVKVIAGGIVARHFGGGVTLAKVGKCLGRWTIDSYNNE